MAILLRPVTDVFHRTAYALQKVSLQDTDGDAEIINATDEHPFFVDGTGWVGAADLVVGDWVMQPDGTFLVVTENSDDKRAEGVAVFNFTVEGNHTYFVEVGIGGNDWAWVHNTCADARALRASLISERHKEGKYAAHIVPTGKFSNRVKEVRAAIRESKAIVKGAKINPNSAANGFFTEFRNHGGTHTNEFFIKMRDVLRDAKDGGPDAVASALRSLVPV